MQVVIRSGNVERTLRREGWASNIQNAALAVFQHYSKWYRQLTVLITGASDLEVLTDKKIIHIKILQL